MPSLFAGMPLVRMLYRNSLRFSSGFPADVPLRSSISRFAILAGIQLVGVGVGVASIPGLWSGRKVASLGVFRCRWLVCTRHIAQTV